MLNSLMFFLPHSTFYLILPHWATDNPTIDVPTNERPNQNKPNQWDSTAKCDKKRSKRHATLKGKCE